MISITFLICYTILECKKIEHNVNPSGVVVTAVFDIMLAIAIMAGLTSILK